MRVTVAVLEGVHWRGGVPTPHTGLCWATQRRGEHRWCPSSGRADSGHHAGGQAGGNQEARSEVWPGFPLLGLGLAPLGWGFWSPRGGLVGSVPLKWVFSSSPPRTPALELELSRPTWCLGCCEPQDGLSCLSSVMSLLSRPETVPFSLPTAPSPQPPPAQLCCRAVIQRWRGPSQSWVRARRVSCGGVAAVRGLDRY